MANQIIKENGDVIIIIIAKFIRRRLQGLTSYVQNYVTVK